MLYAITGDPKPEDGDSEEFPILGGAPRPTRAPDKQIMGWYLKVTDVDLQKISETYMPGDNTA